MDDHPFDEMQWRGDLATLLERHELDQLSGVDADMLADLLADMAARVTDMVKLRDRGMPEAFSAVERAELAALRKENKLLEEIVRDLETRLALAEKQRDLAREQRVALG